ncbi:MAG TPA: hypothetical protein VF702_08435 [Allosphingosinicella sp.]
MAGVKWEKKGLIYRPAGDRPWSRSHAQLPIVDASREDRWRIYYATRDEGGRATISYVEVEAGRPENVLYEHDRPLLPYGPLGAFDESGIMPVAFVAQGRHNLFYAGWSLRTTVPYQNAIGLAVSDDCGASFRKIGEGPLFGLLPHEPFFTGTIAVLVEDGLWRAWYQSCTKWEEIAGAPEPFYHIKYAESDDGVAWRREGRVAIDYAGPSEGGISSATVLKTSGGYAMWYSYRGATGYRGAGAGAYRIGFAESSDGLSWTRRDAQAGIDVSPSGWDSDMIAYPQVLRYGESLFLFYNGNGFGRAGFGYATAPAGPDFG